MPRKSTTAKPAAPVVPVANFSINELFAKEEAGTSVAAPAKKSTSKAPVVYIDDKPAMVKSVGDMIRLLTVFKIIESVTKATKVEALDMLFNLWVEGVWENRNVPDNPKISIRKPDSAATDSSVTFQVRFRKDKIELPDSLKPGQTIQDHLLFVLTSDVVGLSAAHASLLVKNEITVEREYTVPDLKALAQGNDPVAKSGAEKVFRLMMGQPGVEPLTPEEKAKCLVLTDVVRVKEGFMDRCFTYCDTEEQLYNLLKSFIRVELVASNPVFAEGDKKADRDARLEDTIHEYIDSAA